MVIDIITGNHFSQGKLIWETNSFFGRSGIKKELVSHNQNYVIKIGKNSVKIVLSNNHCVADLKEIKTYIELLFKNQTVLIKSTGNLSWLKEIRNVKIYNL